MFRDKIVCVTGGTGSFGRFVVSHLLDMDVGEIRILSRDEKKQWEMKLRYRNESRIRFMICDIRDYDRVLECTAGAHVVFQAAALKQVPRCESNPLDAIRTNVMGVANVVRASLIHGVEKFITISTDKAVKPVNVMGMTKALQERLVIQANHSPLNSGTIFSCVRYGNVLSSRGSIIPLFRDLVRQGKPITITDERMTRFLLTLGDAVKLVFYAYENMKGGEVFVKKAPSSTLLALGRMIADEAGKPFEYDVIGLFPGEKFHEILITEEELARTEDCEGFFVIHPSWMEGADGLGYPEEYCSGNEVADATTIMTLIEKSDEEFETLGIVL